MEDLEKFFLNIGDKVLIIPTQQEGVISYFLDDLIEICTSIGFSLIYDEKLLKLI